MIISVHVTGITWKISIGGQVMVEKYFTSPLHAHLWIKSYASSWVGTAIEYSDSAKKRLSHVI